ncbi:cupin domain-containing protein [Aquincola sp. S2]|uniref:Cupin domain-containing protein n=1 Tax=Pseudaquabacterium terrae TaxID=2732868 RepID=A0ABX2EHF4_9BURK|nr:cupin domain-containing protein [Aquabacterium terrae]
MSGAGGQRRADELVAELGLQPHPEGGWYREFHRAGTRVATPDGRGERSALTSIDFLLAVGQHSAWHRVASDEVWHLLEGPGLRLWTLPPTLDRIELTLLAPVGSDGARPRHVVPAHWWQAAEPAGGHAYVGATVGPGFEFADFSFGRDDDALVAALARLQPDLQRLL